MSYRGRRRTPAILTAAPFRGLPQPEAHYRRNVTTDLQREPFRSALSCCVPAFNHVRRGGILLIPNNQEGNLYD
ncbi:hypothetical protein FQ042_12360 [Escherichia coli]|nr:hypothetical protein [Escherichia coli]